MWQMKGKKRKKQTKMIKIRNKEGEEQPSKKRSKDQFYVVLIGLIGYGFILIAIVIGSFFAIKKAFAGKDAEVAIAVEKARDNPQETAKEEQKEEAAPEEKPKEEPEVSEETKADEHPAELEEYMAADGKVDYTQTVFKPGSRNKDLKWKDSVFSRIENVKNPSKANVNSYTMIRKTATLTTEDRLLELCIYKNPETDQIEKITATEHCPDDLCIIDYYYDKGNINYAAERNVNIDVPVDISSGLITSRYYFSNDTLVKYSYCEDNKATVFSVASLDEYSEGTVQQYEFLESSLINKAYITYNAAKTLEEKQLIEGYIYDEYDQVLADVQIELYKEKDMTEVARTTTDGDGHYSLSIPVNDSDDYVLSASKNEFDEVRIYGITAKSGAGTYFVPTPRMTYASDGAEYNEQILVRDSLDNNVPLADASVRLRAGLNCKEGEVIASSVLDATGAAMFTLQSGNYTAEVSKGGYENSFFNVIITTGRPATIGYAVKDLSEDQMQIILAWDTSPLDIDSRLIGAGGSEVLKPGQDSVGSLMTETISIPSSGDDLYRYYVSDYSDLTGGDANSENMTCSGARVYAYNNEGLVAQYNVPRGHLGVVWEPFMIKNSRVIPVNHYYNVIQQNSIWTTKQ